MYKGGGLIRPCIESGDLYGIDIGIGVGLVRMTGEIQIFCMSYLVLCLKNQRNIMRISGSIWLNQPPPVIYAVAFMLKYYLKNDI